MGIVDWLRKTLGGGGGGGRAGGGEPEVQWVYVQCQRCQEPLRARVNINNELSEGEDEGTWVVRKGIVGSGDRRCFQTVEVTLTFDRSKQNVIDREIVGGQFITEEDYERLLAEPQVAEQESPEAEEKDDA
jgi:hypothetical protein